MMKQLIKLCINDQYISRVLNFSDRETFDCALSTAMREIQSEIEKCYEKIAKNTGGGS